MPCKKMKCKAEFTSDGKGTNLKPIIDCIKNIEDKTSSKDIMASMTQALSEMFNANAKDVGECDNPHTTVVELEYTPNV